MEKKYFDRKEIKKFISSKLKNGTSKTDLLRQLDAEYYEKDLIIKILASTPRIELRKRYSIPNLLFGIIGILLILFRIFSHGFSIVGGGLILLSLILTIMIFNYEAYAYRLLAGVTLITTFQSISKFNGDNLLYVDLFLGVSVIALALFLGHKLFSNFGFLGPKKDNNGDVILG